MRQAFNPPDWKTEFLYVVSGAQRRLFKSVVEQQK
jgi:hypothetical protein